VLLSTSGSHGRIVRRSSFAPLLMPELTPAHSDTGKMKELGRCKGGRPMPIADRWQWVFGAQPEHVWPIVADTSRFNRALGMPLPLWQDHPLPEGGSRRTGRATMLGMRLEWEEHPFHWQQDCGYGVMRDYVRGPLTQLKVDMALDPMAGAGTRVTWNTSIQVRSPLFAPAVRVMLKRLHKRFNRYCRALERQLEQRESGITAGSSSQLAPAARSRLTRIRTELLASEFPASWVELLMVQITAAADADLARLRPFAFADTWGAPRMDVLRFFLHAAKAGLLDLSWDLVCPHCRGAKVRRDSLTELPESGYCPSCNVDFSAHFDASVELTFQPSGAIRPVTSALHCVGGPANTPHVLCQAALDPGQKLEWLLPPDAPTYRLRAAQPMGMAMVHLGAGMDRGPGAFATAALAIHDSGIVPEEVHVEGAPARVEVANLTDTKRLVKLELPEWTQPIVTASLVSTLQDFRNLFAKEILAPGMQIRVSNLAFLFTDLKSSTQMYEKHGDAKAFGLVRSHFDMLEGAVSGEGGSVVKTIGDAIMAVFSDPASCVKAGLRIQQEFGQLASSAEIPLIVKIGAHMGPCLAVTLNDRLDYFGSTVNIAARVQGVSEGQDFVLTAALAEDPGAIRILADCDWSSEHCDIRLKGLAGAFQLVRLWPRARTPAELPAAP
ncbi:MAG: hypothetical protein KGR26_02400, partial [Cyanobacteria bacterium REEB65]|nr:hypothetical protein [Cyanobacteria bacterium REEB65]